MDNNRNSKLLIIIIIVSFAAGILGGGLFDKVIMPFIEKGLGKSNNVIIGDKTEKITVEENSAVIDSVKKVSPSVVSIIGTSNVMDFFGDISQQKGEGTGFILTSDGLVMTNKHVVSDSSANYKVMTSDGKSYKANILAKDPLSDLAILKIDAKNLKVVELGDSDELQIGEKVIAIGNALGEFDNTITTGVISAKGRPIQASDQSGQGQEMLEGLLQTDAAINPGNSGGPLLNLRGQVIGINTAVASAENIGFAIPINVAKPAIDSVSKSGKIVRPMMGVRYISVTSDLATLNNLPVSKGAWVYSGSDLKASVLQGGPASKAGIKDKDIITRVGDQEIDKAHGLSSIIQKYKPGDIVDITYLRDGKENRTKLTFSELS